MVYANMTLSLTLTMYTTESDIICVCHVYDIHSHVYEIPPDPVNHVCSLPGK